MARETAERGRYSGEAPGLWKDASRWKDRQNIANKIRLAAQRENDQEATKM